MLSIQPMGDATCLEGAATWWSSLFVKVLLAACPIKINATIRCSSSCGCYSPTSLVTGFVVAVVAPVHDSCGVVSINCRS